MTTVVIELLYGLLLIGSLSCGLYAGWAYHDCPVTRSHKPYVFPIVVCTGWFLFAIDGLVALASGVSNRPDAAAATILALATIITLSIFVYYYRRHRHEAKRATDSIHHSNR